MIENDAFWDKEVEAPLLDRNAGFITRKSVPALLTRANEWANLVEDRGHVEIPEWKTTCSHPASLRIFELDAERTFKDEKHRRDLVETLCTIYDDIQDYHQGMGFIVAFLLLFLEKKRVAQLVLGLDRFYVTGYFKAAPVAYVRDAKTYEYVLQKLFPDACKHITSLVPAEAYCSKWFVGFNVHVLPFAALADFLDAFFASGEEFRFQYAMAVIQNTQRDILATRDVGKVLEYLRLDAKVYPNGKTAVHPPPTSHQSTDDSKGSSLPGSFFTKIVADALAFDLKDIDIDRIRETVVDEMAQEQARRQKREAELLLNEDDDEIVFSDEE